MVKFMKTWTCNQSLKHTCNNTCTEKPFTSCKISVGCDGVIEIPFQVIHIISQELVDSMTYDRNDKINLS